MRWAAHWPAVGDINRWDTHVVLVVDLASDRGSIPRASTDSRSSKENGAHLWAPFFLRTIRGRPELALARELEAHTQIAENEAIAGDQPRRLD